MIARLLCLPLLCVHLAVAGTALAHHGLMIWDEDTVHVVEGFVSEEMDGFPHWEIEVRADGQDWTIDLGSDFEMGRAGLDPAILGIGTEVRIEGQRPRGSEALLLRPVRIIVGNKPYEFERGD